METNMQYLETDAQRGITIVEQPPGAMTLAVLIDRAATALAEAKSAAEVLEARDMASFAYDVAKKTARLAKAKQAHDELIRAAHRAQADALTIEAQAKRRLADEYDAAQERGDVARLGTNQKDLGLPEQKTRPATVKEIGLTHKQVHEARLIRDAETVAPGVVRRTVDEAVANGEEPTKAKVRNAVEAVVSNATAAETAASDHRVRPDLSPKEWRRVFKERPVLKRVGEYLEGLRQFADCLNHDDFVLDLIPECWRITPVVFWDYLSLMCEDERAGYEDVLKDAAKALKAILAAKPKAAPKATQ